jgi:hypothetical protein
MVPEMTEFGEPVDFADASTPNLWDGALLYWAGDMRRAFLMPARPRTGGIMSLEAVFVRRCVLVVKI